MPLAFVLFQNMSSSAAIHSNLLNEIADITECSICFGVFQEPRCLPCAHTFCLGCLEVYGKGTKPSSKALCPMCRKKFSVPAGGWKNLPRNYIVEKLLSTNPGKVAVKNSWQDERSLSTDYLSKSVALQITKCEQMASQLKGRADYLSNKTQDVEQDILRHRDELKMLVDSNAEELVSRLNHICESACQELAASQKDMEARCSQLKVLQTKLNETADSTDPKDPLETIAMKMKPLMLEPKCDLLEADISFAESQLPAFPHGNIVGSVEMCKKAEVTSKRNCFIAAGLQTYIWENLLAYSCTLHVSLNITSFFCE